MESRNTGKRVNFHSVWFLIFLHFHTQATVFGTD